MKSKARPAAGKKSVSRDPAPVPHAVADILTAACLLFLGAALFLSPLTASRFEPVTARSMQLLILAALATFALRQRQAGRPADAISADRFLLAFLGWSLLSFIPSVYKHATLSEFSSLAAYTAAFWLLTRLAGRAAVFFGMAACLLAAGGVASVAGLREYGLSGDPTWRTFSTFFNPNLFATFLITLLPFALVCLLSARHPMAAFGSGLAAVLMGAALMATGSRAGVGCGLFGLAAAGLGSLLRRPAIPRPAWMRLLIVIALLGLASLRVARPFTERVAATTTTQAHSGSFRLLTWQATLDMVKSRPILGTGLGTYASVFPQYARSGYTGMAHNTFLQYASETGLPGLILFLAFLLSLARHALLPLLRPAFSSRWPEPPPEGTPFAFYDARLIGLGLAGGAAAAIAHNLIDYGWYLFGSALPFWAVLGLLTALTTSPAPLVGINRRIYPALAACFILVFVLGTIPSWLAAMNASRAETALESGSVLIAEEAYRSAARLDPWNASYQRSLGQILSARAAQTGSDADRDKALLHFRKAVALQPTDAVHRYGLGRALAQAGRSREAIEVFQEALRYNPHSTPVLLELARAHEAAGQKAQALSFYRRLADQERSAFETVKAIPELVDTRYAEANLSLARTAAARGDRAEAAARYRAALDTLERYQKFLKSSPTAAADREQGKTEAAERMIEEAKRGLEGLR